MTTNDDFNPGTKIARATVRVASSAKDGTAGAGADRALGAAFGMLDQARQDTAPVVGHGIDQARGWVDERTGRVQDGVRAVRDKAKDLTGQFIDFTRDEPVKALLIAAAVGAGLMGLLSLVARPRD